MPVSFLFVTSNHNTEIKNCNKTIVYYFLIMLTKCSNQIYFLNLKFSTAYLHY